MAHSAELSNQDVQDFLHDTLRDFLQLQLVEPAFDETEYCPTTISRFQKLNISDSGSDVSLEMSSKEGAASDNQSRETNNNELGHK